MLYQDRLIHDVVDLCTQVWTVFDAYTVVMWTVFDAYTVVMWTVFDAYTVMLF